MQAVAPAARLLTPLAFRAEVAQNKGLTERFRRRADMAPAMISPSACRPVRRAAL